jgi:hypothetical protein
VAQAQRYIADGYNVVVDLDLEKFFDRVNHDGLMARVATLELVHNEAGVAIGQLRGACNAKAPKEVLRAVNSWLRAQKEFRFPQKRPDRLLDDDIPF